MELVENYCSPTPITYFDGEKYCTFGLVLIYFMSQFHKHQFEDTVHTCPKTGWASAREDRNPDVYTS